MNYFSNGLPKNNGISFIPHIMIGGHFQSIKTVLQKVMIIKLVMNNKKYCKKIDNF
jgi:hypothetical protein